MRGLLLLSLLLARPADACEFLPFPAAFETNGSPTGARLPAPGIEVEVHRALHGPPGFGDCAEIAHIEISVPGTRGILIEAADVPAGIVLPDHPVRVENGSAWVAWVDHPLRPMAFTLRVSAVDEAGNRSEPVSLTVEDPGRGHQAALAAGIASALGITTALWLRRRRASRRSTPPGRPAPPPQTPR